MLSKNIKGQSSVFSFLVSIDPEKDLRQEEDKAQFDSY